MFHSKSYYLFYFRRMEKAGLSRSLASIAHLRGELSQAEKELTKERIKSRALEEELQNPINIHRWRKLEVRLDLK